MYTEEKATHALPFLGLAAAVEAYSVAGFGGSA